VRRHPHHPLTGRDQRLLEPPRDVPAVLDRPQPLVIEPAPPAHGGQIPLLLSSDLAGAALSARPRVDGASACVRFCVSAPITIIRTVPSVWFDADEVDLRPTTVTRADATLLTSHAEVLERRRATQAWPVRPDRRHRRLESARRQPENQPQRSDVTPHTRAPCQ
jgi:hypothetical protein